MDFRFGNIAAVYYEILGEKMPRQLELLDAWFPGLIVVADESDGETKRDAEYMDQGICDPCCEIPWKTIFRRKCRGITDHRKTGRHGHRQQERKNGKAQSLSRSMWRNALSGI